MTSLRKRVLEAGSALACSVGLELELNAESFGSCKSTEPSLHKPYGGGATETLGGPKL